jgi:hypothetical protein
MRLSDGTEERGEERIKRKERETLKIYVPSQFILSEQMLAQEQKSKSLSIHLTLNMIYLYSTINNTLVVIEKYRIRKKGRREKNERGNIGCGYESERGQNKYFPNR